MSGSELDYPVANVLTANENDTVLVLITYKIMFTRSEFSVLVRVSTVFSVFDVAL